MGYSIDQIEALTEQQVESMAKEKMVIKDHNIYFVNLDGAFKYSALVFKNEHHIYYANDYELHHPSMSRKDLKKWYIDTLNNKLFTDNEFISVSDYTDYRNKSYYLSNYYIMQIDYISAFHIFHDDEERKAYEKKTKKMLFNQISFCYIDKNDLPFCKHQIELMDQLEKARENRETDFNYLKDAFLMEMYNHEYSINWDADADTLGSFGNIPREVTWNRSYTLDDLFNALNFTDIQKSAYIAARKEYYNQVNESSYY